jgi:pyrroloquinoline quinone biosynthesis protein A
MRISIGIALALTIRPLINRRGYAVSPMFNSMKETAMQWTTPAYTDLRFGFEITMYIANR